MILHIWVSQNQWRKRDGCLGCVVPLAEIYVDARQACIKALNISYPKIVSDMIYEWYIRLINLTTTDYMFRLYIFSWQLLSKSIFYHSFARVAMVAIRPWNCCTLLLNRWRFGNGRHAVEYRSSPFLKWKQSISSGWAGRTISSGLPVSLDDPNSWVKEFHVLSIILVEVAALWVKKGYNLLNKDGGQVQQHLGRRFRFFPIFHYIQFITTSPLVSVALWPLFVRTTTHAFLNLSCEYQNLWSKRQKFSQSS